MIYIIFNTRNSLFALSKKLKDVGISHNVVNTPKNMGRSCSLSIRMNQEEYQKAKGIISLSSGEIYAIKRG